MIRSLHSMTPQFRRAENKNYLSLEKRTISTALSGLSSSSKRRSLSVKKSTQTTAFNTTVKTARDFL